MPGLTGPRRALAVVAGASTAAWLLVWAAVPLDGPWREATINLLWIPLAVSVGLLAVATGRAEGGRTRLPLTLMGLGAVAWAAGQAIWAVAELAPVDRYPYVMDVPFAAAFLLFACGVFTWPRRAGRWTTGDVVDLALVLGICFLFSYEFVLGALLEHGKPALLQLGLVAYPLGDLVLGATIVAGLLIGRFEQRGRIAVVGLGMAALVLSDTLFAIHIDTYDAGAFYDVGWTLAFVAVAACALLRPSFGERLRVPQSAAPARVVALVVVVSAFALTENDRGMPHEGFVDTGVAGALLGLLAVRYVGLAVERVREQRRLQGLRDDLERETQLRRATLELSRTGVCVLDGRGEAAFGNSAWLALGRDAFPDVADVVLAGEPVRHEHDGRVLAFSAARLDGGETVLTVDDVTQDARERATRDRFLAEVVRAQDVEARRVAELLHDDAVQQLTALALRLELAAMQRGDEMLGVLAADAASITAAIRRLLVDLHPAVLESRGLAAAIESAADHARASGVDVHVSAFEHRLPPELEQLAYRAVQEALANVLEHASASTVQVTLALDADALSCTVEDDGVGTRPEDVADALGRGALGIHLVRERIELAGGRFSIAAQATRGTRFSFDLPVPDDASAADRETQEVHA